jgi:hypothetical protein
MGKPPKHRVPNSRITEKGTRPQNEKVLSSMESYTPSGAKISPAWIPVLMFSLLALGTIMIITNYVALLPGGTDNWYLVGGLGLILAGIITATQYH